MLKHYLNTERSHLMNPSMNVVLKAEFKGEFNEEAFRKAVTALTDAYAILRATVQMDEKGRAYFLLASAKEVPVEIMGGGTSFEKLVLNENMRMFDLEKESLLRIFVIPLPDTFSVIFISHHLLGDGKSSMLLMEALCRAYTGSNPEYIGIQLMKSSECFPKKSEPTELVKMYLGNLNKAWRKESSIFTYQDYKEMFEQYQRERESGLYLMKLNAVETRKAYYNCKKLGITLNSGIVAALMYAQKEIDERHYESIDKIGIAVDIRDELNFKADKLIGNYASALTIDYGKLGWDDYPKTAVKVHKKLKRKLKNPKTRWLCLQMLDWLEDTLIDAVYFSEFGDFENKTAQKCAKMVSYDGQPMELGVTNLGKALLNLPQELSLESLVFIPPAAPSNDITVGVITYQGIMQFGITYQTSYVRRETVKKIGDRMKELLTAV